jgi:hypothetical protein
MDPRLLAEVTRLARAEGLSLNQAALRLLRKAAGLVEAKERHIVGDALLPWIGTWSRKEADEILASIQSCEQVDPEMWA